MSNTQCNIQMMHHRNVHLKPMQFRRPLSPQYIFKIIKEIFRVISSVINLFSTNLTLGYQVPSMPASREGPHECSSRNSFYRTNPIQPLSNQTAFTRQAPMKSYVPLSNKSFQHTGLSYRLPHVITQCIHNLKLYDFSTLLLLTTVSS